MKLKLKEVIRIVSHEIDPYDSLHNIDIFCKPLLINDYFYVISSLTKKRKNLLDSLSMLYNVLM